MSSSGQSDAAAAIITVLGLCAFFFGLLLALSQISKHWKQSVQKRIVKALKSRRNEKDTFRATYGYSWDYFIAFRVYDETDPVSELQRRYSLKYVLNQLTDGGLEVRLFYSLQKKEIFCKIRCPLARLQKHADLVDYKLALDAKSLQTLCEAGRDGLWDPLKIPVNSELTNMNPYDFIYAKYEFDSDTGRTRGDMLPVYKRWTRLSPSELLRIAESNESQVANPLSAEPLSEIDPEEAGPYAGVSLKEEASMFRDVDRLKLIHMIISFHGEGGCMLDPNQLLKDECILACGPLHDLVELGTLEKDWLTLFSWPWNQPLDRIKDYFGEKIGLYFTWLGVYTAWLIPAAVLGFCVWISIAADDNSPDSLSMPYFAGLMGLWSALFLENFKRVENVQAMRWGMTGFEEEEQHRPQFTGEKILSPITGKATLYFARAEAMRRSLLSQAVVTVLVLIVIAVVAIIFAIQIGLRNSGFQFAGTDMSGIVASILLAIQIQFLNGYFGEVALRLNNRENHRTDTEFEDALIAKTFCFQFVNSFASLFYIAFIKPFIPNTDACGKNGCMGDLQTTLSTIFITRLLLGNVTELGVPMLMTFLERKQRKTVAVQHDVKMRASRHGRDSDGGQSMELGVVNSQGTAPFDADAAAVAAAAKTQMSEVEKAFIMPEYHVMLGPFQDFAEMVIQFGYTTMFVAAFPLATVLSLANNYVEIRVDAWKLCHLSRRPEPRSMEDIGTWYLILELISMSSIFINSALVAFTSSNCVNYSWPERIWIFILMASGLFFIRAVVAYLIPDEPEEVQIQLDRQEYIVGKVLDNIEDEADALGKTNFETPGFLVLPTDDDPM